MRALEDRLRAAELAAPATSSTAAPGAPPLTANAAAAASVGSTSANPGASTFTAPSSGFSPSAASAPTGIAAFNPAIALVLQGVYANLKQDPQRYGFTGFAKADEVSPGRRGLGLGESELTLSANVDERFAGNLTFSLTPENTVSVEEAYGTMPSLPNGFVPKFGRFFSGIGYLNEQHQHAWDFYDAPLAYQAFLGGQFGQDGAQLKWIVPTDLFVELGAEIGDGQSFPGSARNRNGVGAGSLYAHAGGDIGTSHSWRAGLSYLDTRADTRAATQQNIAGELADVAFTGKSRLAIADFVWKYAPFGNGRERNFKVQGEYLWRREHGDLVVDAVPGQGPAQLARYSSNQRGWYLQGVWQFQPALRVGARYDRLNPRHPEYGANADLLEIASFHPHRATVMLDYTPSEFSRFRLQYAQGRTRADLTDHQVFLQYILTLGAHGAHKF